MTGAGTAAGAGTATLTRGCDFPLAAAAVDGLPAIAATTIKTMIADVRLPVFFLAMSLSLSPQNSLPAVAVKHALPKHFVRAIDQLRPPSGGRSAAIHSIEGSAIHATRPRKG